MHYSLYGTAQPLIIKSMEKPLIDLLIRQPHFRPKFKTKLIRLYGKIMFIMRKIDRRFKRSQHSFKQSIAKVLLYLALFFPSDSPQKCLNTTLRNFSESDTS